MMPKDQLHTKTPPVLRNRGLVMLDVGRVGVPLVKNIIKAGGKVQIFPESPGIKCCIHDEEATQIGSRDRPSPACGLSLNAGKNLFTYQRQAEIHLGELVRG